MCSCYDVCCVPITLEEIARFVAFKLKFGSISYSPLFPQWLLPLKGL